MEDCVMHDWQKVRGKVKGQMLHNLLSKGVTYHLWEVPINSLPSNVISEPELWKRIKDTKHIVWRTFKDINLYRKKKKSKGKKTFLTVKAWKMAIEIYSGKSVTLKKESFLKSV